MKYSEIKKFTNPGSYAVDIPIDRIGNWVKEMKEEMNLQMNPDFQRGHVWTPAQQTAYVEFILREGNSGKDVYFNCPSWHISVPKGAYDEFVCVDGLQRITAIMAFFNNEIPAFGLYAREFEGKPNFMLTLRFHVNALKSKKEVLNWYLEMNSGGTPHTQEELDRVQKMCEEL